MKPVIGVTCARSTQDRRYALHHHYVEAVIDAGGLPFLLPGAPGLSVQDVAKEVDGIIISGGVDVDPKWYGEEPHVACGEIDPIADAFDMELCCHFLKENKPILGICRGSQILNVAAGGTLYQDVAHQAGTTLQHRQKAPDWYPTHQISVTEGSLLKRVLGVSTLQVNSFHHQAVRQVAPGFAAVAHAQDGIIEAIEKQGDGFVLGVQWHPERTYTRTKEEFVLFEEFVRFCGGNSDPHF